MDTKVAQLSPGRNDVPQDAVLDASYRADDPLKQAQRELIVYIYGEDALTNPQFHGERADLLRLAVKLQAILHERWTLFNAAERLTVHSMELVFGSVPPSEEARQQVQDYAESYLEDLPVIFSGDGKVRPAFRTHGRVS